jgi:hypothetical protein
MFTDVASSIEPRTTNDEPRTRCGCRLVPVERGPLSGPGSRARSGGRSGTRHVYERRELDRTTNHEPRTTCGCQLVPGGAGPALGPRFSRKIRRPKRPPLHRNAPCSRTSRARSNDERRTTNHEPRTTNQVRLPARPCGAGPGSRPRSAAPQERAMFTNVASSIELRTTNDEPRTRCGCQLVPVERGPLSGPGSRPRSAVPQERAMFTDVASSIEPRTTSHERRTRPARSPLR